MDTPRDKPERIARKRHSTLQRFRLWRCARKAAGDPRAFEAAFETFRAGVSGSLPQATRTGVILVACNDLYYWRFAITLLLSIEQHEHDAPVHLHLCAPGAETLAHLADLSRTLRQVRLSWTIDDCRLAAGLQHRTVYLTAARFLIARSILETLQGPLLCLDVDAIAARPVWAGYAQARSAGDVLLIQRPELKHVTRKILASAVGYNPGAAGLQFASSVARAIAASFALGPLYHVDQILIYYVMRELQRRSALAVAQMPAAMADYTFSPDAVFWMPKGWASKDSAQYAEAKRAVDACFPLVPQQPDATLAGTPG